jgi:YbbR domain-containing protein
VIITKQDPEFVSLRTELVDESVMALTVRKVGKVDGNFSVGNELLSRSSVNVRGPETLISQVKVCEVQVDLEGADADIAATLPVQLRDQDGAVPRAPDQLRPRPVDYSLKLIPIGSIKVLQIIPRQPACRPTASCWSS